MKVLVLAAGKGIRMMPLTIDKPKVLIPVAGKPFLYYVLQNIRKAGFADSDVYVMVYYKKELIETFVNENGFDVTLIDQEGTLGTGHAVMQAAPFIKENFVVIQGDNLYSPEDIRRIAVDDELCYVGAFRSSHPKDYGVLETKTGMLVGIEEKPQAPKSDLVNTGLYKFAPEIFHELKKLKKSERGEYEVTDAITALAKAGKVKAIKLHDYWVDLSVKEKLPEIEKEVIKAMKL
jgi:dTDP-glucose pyrophosphorylase